MKAHTAPSVSASERITPPCITPPAVHRSGAHASEPAARSGAGCSSSIPRESANGISSRSCSAVGISSTGAGV